MKKKNIIIALIFFLICFLAINWASKNQIASEDQIVPNKAIVVNQGFRVSAEVSNPEKDLQNKDYIFSISIEYLGENAEAIIFHTSPPYMVTLTSLDTNEKTSLFDWPAIEKRTRITSDQPFFSQVLLSKSAAANIQPGDYKAVISCPFDFLETDNDLFASPDGLKELDDAQRQHFSCSFSFFLKIE